MRLFLNRTTSSIFNRICTFLWVLYSCTAFDYCHITHLIFACASRKHGASFPIVNLFLLTCYVFLLDIFFPESKRHEKKEKKTNHSNRSRRIWSTSAPVYINRLPHHCLKSFRTLLLENGINIKIRIVQSSDGMINPCSTLISISVLSLLESSMLWRSFICCWTVVLSSFAETKKLGTKFNSS